MAVNYAVATQYGPGQLFAAPYGTALPTTLSSTLDPAFIALGATVDGSTFTYQIQTSPLMIEESYRPVKVATTGVTETLVFNLAELTHNHLKAAFNGGIVTAGAVTASFAPPAPGTETRLSIVWQSDDALQRWYYTKCINTSSVAIARRKAPNFTSIPFSMALEAPTSGQDPWHYFLDASLNV